MPTRFRPDGLNSTLTDHAQQVFLKQTLAESGSNRRLNFQLNPGHPPTLETQVHQEVQAKPILFV